MRLSERLKQLVGHCIAVDIPTEEDEWSRIKGILQEVGEDYIMITDWDSIAGFPISGQCFVKINQVIPIIHTCDYRQCYG